MCFVVWYVEHVPHDSNKGSLKRGFNEMYMYMSQALNMVCNI